MARLNDGIKFTGSIGNLSAYMMHGSNKIILRSKGGASRDKIKKSPAFEYTRRLNAEFGGSSSCGKAIRNAMFPLLGLADYNFSGSLVSLIKKIQCADKENPVGTRDIYLSKNRELLDGFSLNLENDFDGVVKPPFQYTFFREEARVNIMIPSLTPGIHLKNPFNQPFFNILVCLGMVSDMKYSASSKQYLPVHLYGDSTYIHYSTGWQVVSEPFSGQAIELKFPGNRILDENDTLILSAGIDFGDLNIERQIVSKKYTGCAKIRKTC